MEQERKQKQGLSNDRIGSDADGQPVGDPYRDLAAAIVMQAVKDYIKVFRRYRNAGKTARIRLDNEKKELENFFYSQWFEALCGLDPQAVIQALQGKVREEEQRAGICH